MTSQSPPGRFLQRDPTTQLWFYVEEEKAIEKTSQALREGGILARSQELYERGITGASLNLRNPHISATQLTMSGDQTPSAISIYMPSVKDAHKIVGGTNKQGAASPKVEEPANVQATSMYNSQQQSYGSLQHELYGHEQHQEHSNPPYGQQVRYDQAFGQAPPPTMHHANQYHNHSQYHQGPPSSVPYPQQQYQPTHPPLPRGMEPYYAPVASNTSRPPCGGGAATTNAPLSLVSGHRAAEIIAAAIAASHAADSNTNGAMSTLPATGNSMPTSSSLPIMYPPAVSNNTTQEVESVSTQESGSKVSHDGSRSKASHGSNKVGNSAVVTSSAHANEKQDDNAHNSATDATAPTRPEPLEKPATSLGSISAMSVSQVMPTIQTSFGSMSLEECSMKKAIMPNKIDTSAPTLTHHERSKGDLLDDSDSDEETSNVNTADWEKMRAAFGITENDFRPVGNVTGMDLTRDISEMSREISGMSMGDFSLERSPSSTYMMRDTTVGSIGSRKKDDYEMSEEEKLEKMLLGRGKSLVNEDFGTNEQK